MKKIRFLSGILLLVAFVVALSTSVAGFDQKAKVQKIEQAVTVPEWTVSFTSVVTFESTNYARMDQPVLLLLSTTNSNSNSTATWMQKMMNDTGQDVKLASVSKSTESEVANTTKVKSEGDLMAATDIGQITSFTSTTESVAVTNGTMIGKMLPSDVGFFQISFNSSNNVNDVSMIMALSYPGAESLIPVV
ncbi:TPA: hypothetical protein DEP30_03405 [Candidatus Nomurabacteria bacterium]|nr:MAG: hypothetical protein UR97_C0007G0033 [Candidatus Nomurabacteria bacterium GW2011_GWE2_36_115]KKP93437.1 MAG: hypothetical protein US00_C0007G0059 [Candidatus Nomurabacteria bacterium GW2011_GWF2_36_126]KKP96555.1 MAG: hypothetical protein US04_C0001G0057 [Candidatus Nomurabacteria bacterium GW2011_GWD2_36_14]KKP99841.1 MAG: hypothetical protein US08_C0001G0524 [Candidatus Nomurabacteria bacterium GW2011_GWF2_36_19]KKQ05120.1 MAG: hypothetical protein US17_C0007G0033 [Candidatus Nomuraba